MNNNREVVSDSKKQKLSVEMKKVNICHVIMSDSPGNVDQRSND